MTLSLTSDGGICSLAWLRGWGEGIVGGTHYHSEVLEHPPAVESTDDLLHQLVQLRSSFASYNTWGTSVKKLSCVIAVVSPQLQPLAFAALKEVGFDVRHVPEYGKYPHDLAYCMIHGKDLDDAITAYKKRKEKK